jgi:hypothetical protein
MLPADCKLCISTDKGLLSRMQRKSRPKVPAQLPRVQASSTEHKSNFDKTPNHGMRGGDWHKRKQKRRQKRKQEPNVDRPKAPLENASGLA